jgi:hypothetical protein
MLGHDTPTRLFVRLAQPVQIWAAKVSACVPCHALVPPSGSVDTKAIPRAPTATQNVEVAHETAESRSGDLNVTSFGEVTTFHELVPPDGLLVVAMTDRPTATQKVADGQETPFHGPPFWIRDVGSAVCCHVPAPPVGLVDSITPTREVATHRFVVGQDTAPRGLSQARSIALQVDGPPAGAPLTRMSPPLLVATHNVAAGQLMLVSWPSVTGSVTSFDQDMAATVWPGKVVVVVAGDSGTGERSEAGSCDVNGGTVVGLAPSLREGADTPLRVPWRSSPTAEGDSRGNGDAPVGVAAGVIDWRRALGPVPEVANSTSANTPSTRIAATQAIATRLFCSAKVAPVGDCATGFSARGNSKNSSPLLSSWTEDGLTLGGSTPSVTRDLPLPAGATQANGRETSRTEDQPANGSLIEPTRLSHLQHPGISAGPLTQ